MHLCGELGSNVLYRAVLCCGEKREEQRSEVGRGEFCGKGEAPNGCQLPNKLQSLQPTKNNNKKKQKP